MSWPFDAWHTLAVRQFGLSPAAFWAMPLRDWLHLITPEHTPMTRERLIELMEANHCG